MNRAYSATALSANRPDRTNALAHERATLDAQVKPSLAMRKYAFSYLGSNGDVLQNEQIGPVLPAFERAFSAFARGTLIDTQEGPVAVEDLVPGMRVISRAYGPMPLLWVGSMTLVPDPDGFSDNTPQLTRIMADAFGPGRPMSDVMAGPAARILARPAALRGSFGDEQLLTPAHDLADGLSAISLIPRRPISMFHLCLRHHGTVTAAGLEVETFHPGIGFERNMGRNMLSLFLSFFPHIHEPRDFGTLAHPRLPFVASEGIELA